MLITWNSSPNHNPARNSCKQSLCTTIRSDTLFGEAMVGDPHKVIRCHKIDAKLNWTRQILEVKKGFVGKLNMLKRSRFLPGKILLDILYLKVILPSVTYALPVWVVLIGKTIYFNFLEILHCRALELYMAYPEICLHV